MQLFMTKRWVRIDLLDTNTLYTERPPHFRDSFETFFIKQANSHWFKGFGGTGGYTERQIQFLSLINKTKKIINYAYGIYFLLCFITFNILLKKKTVQIRVKNAVGPKSTISQHTCSMKCCFISWKNGTIDFVYIYVR